MRHIHLMYMSWTDVNVCLSHTVHAAKSRAISFVYRGWLKVSLLLSLSCQRNKQLEWNGCEMIIVAVVINIYLYLLLTMMIVALCVDMMKIGLSCWGQGVEKLKLFY